ncbi:MAG: hypothetical protein VKJ24_15565 [Synechococcales bacterium]|nr:hypothetical protein [Synechococcales bacterium]
MTQSTADNPLKGALTRWWKTIQTQTEQFQQTIAKRDTGKIYREAFQRTWQLLKQGVTLIALFFLSIAGVVIGLLLVGFNAGRWLREWLELEEPTPNKIWLKTLDVLLAPLRWTVILLDKALKAAFGWDLKLTEKLPPEYSPAQISDGKSE